MEPHHQPQTVRVVDFDMSITSLIVLFLKMAVAAIPAMFIIWFVTLFFGIVAAMMLGVGGAVFGN